MITHDLVEAWYLHSLERGRTERVNRLLKHFPLQREVAAYSDLTPRGQALYAVIADREAGGVQMFVTVSRAAGLLDAKTLADTSRRLEWDKDDWCALLYLAGVPIGAALRVLRYVRERAVNYRDGVEALECALEAERVVLIRESEHS